MFIDARLSLCCPPSWSSSAGYLWSRRPARSHAAAVPGVPSGTVSARNRRIIHPDDDDDDFEPDLNAFARSLLVSVLQAGLQFARTRLWGERGGRVFRAAHQGGADSHWTGETLSTPTCNTQEHKRVPGGGRASVLQNFQPAY